MQYNTFTLLLRKGILREGEFPIWNGKLYKKQKQKSLIAFKGQFNKDIQKSINIFDSNIFHKIDIEHLEFILN